MTLARHDRNHPEEAQFQVASDVFGRFDRVVQVVDRESYAQSEGQTEGDCKDPVAAVIGCVGPARDRRAIDHSHVVGAAVRDDA